MIKLIKRVSANFVISAAIGTIFLKSIASNESYKI